MTAKSNPLLDKITRVQDALKAGKLDNHGTAKSQRDADKQAVSSWGPMMRV